jgi:hypothetical protein
MPISDVATIFAFSSSLICEEKLRPIEQEMDGIRMGNKPQTSICWSQVTAESSQLCTTGFPFLFRVKWMMSLHSGEP